MNTGIAADRRCTKGRGHCALPGGAAWIRALRERQGANRARVARRARCLCHVMAQRADDRGRPGVFRSSPVGPLGGGSAVREKKAAEPFPAPKRTDPAPFGNGMNTGIATDWRGRTGARTLRPSRATPWIQALREH